MISFLDLKNNGRYRKDLIKALTRVLDSDIMYLVQRLNHSSRNLLNTAVLGMP